MPKIELDELKKWKKKLETEHEKWKNELETEQNRLISDCRLQFQSNRESKDWWICTEKLHPTL